MPVKEECLMDLIQFTTGMQGRLSADLIVFSSEAVMLVTFVVVFLRLFLQLCVGSEIEVVDMKMEAMKKVYAEMILNTTNEAATRMMLAETKALEFQKDLIFFKDDCARIMLHQYNFLNSQIEEAKARSLNQQKKIDELEAQLGEAEGIIVDLRYELKHLHEKLETVTKNDGRPSTGFTAGRKDSVCECLSQVSNAKADIVGIASPNPIALNSKTFCEMDNYSSPGKSNSDGACDDDENFSSFIMQTTETELCRNGYPQRIRAFKRNSSNMQPPTLKDNDPQCLVNVPIETGEAPTRTNSQLPVTKKAYFVHSVEQPFSVCPSKIDEKNLNSIGDSKDQAIRTPRRSAGKNARYRQAIASLQGKPRKKYVRSWKLPLLGKLNACSTHLNVESIKNLTQENRCCTTVSEDSSPKSEVNNKDRDVLSGGELDNTVCVEGGEEEEANEELSKKIRLMWVDGLVGSELVDVPISEGLRRPSRFAFPRKCQKNVVGKLDKNVTRGEDPMERNMDNLTDVYVVESYG